MHLASSTVTLRPLAVAKQVAWSWKWTALRRLERWRALSRLADSTYGSPLPGGRAENGMAAAALPGGAGSGRRAGSAGGRAEAEEVWGRRGAADMAAAKRKRDVPAARPKKRAKGVPSAPEPGAETGPAGAEYSVPPPVSQVPASPAGPGRAGCPAPLRSPPGPALSHRSAVVPVSAVPGARLLLPLLLPGPGCRDSGSLGGGTPLLRGGWRGVFVFFFFFLIIPAPVKVTWEGTLFL